MKIPTIEITPEELKEIYYSRLYYPQGSEGMIIKGADKREARKIFFKDFESTEKTEEEMQSILENKLKKIECLYQLSDFNNDVRVERAVICEGNFIGYDMVSDIPKQDYIVAPLYYKDKIESLKKVRDKIEYFHSIDIVYGDVRGTNILIDETLQEISFCDLDNIQIGEFSIDLFYSGLSITGNTKRLDPSVDIYMYNFLCLQELCYPELSYREIRKNLSSSIFSARLMPEGMEMIHQMEKIKTKYEGGYLIDYFKK